MPVITEIFGKTEQGKDIHAYTVSNEAGMTMKLTDMGASLVSLTVKDSEGNDNDIVLGLKSGEMYEKHNWDAMGATIGRNANRISGHSFELNGKKYTLADNAAGCNIHSGPDVYYGRLWQGTPYSCEDGSGICFSLISPDGDQGMPGNLRISVTYILKKDNSLVISYEGMCDADTVINMTNHSYFNLNGHASGSIDNHLLWVDADRAMYGEGRKPEKVEQTAYDFRKIRKIGTYGYDHNYCINGYDGSLRHISTLVSDKTGMAMDLYTDRCGVQIYTANQMNNGFSAKEGAYYGPRSGIAMETQFYPDAVNHPEYESPIVKAGEQYRSCTVFRFYQWEGMK